MAACLLRRRRRKRDGTPSGRSSSPYCKPPTRVRTSCPAARVGSTDHLHRDERRRLRTTWRPARWVVAASIVQTAQRTGRLGSVVWAPSYPISGDSLVFSLRLCSRLEPYRFFMTRVRGKGGSVSYR